MSDRTFTFDKFIKDLEDKEADQKRVHEAMAAQEAEWQRRVLLQKYREHPLNLRKVQK